MSPFAMLPRSRRSLSLVVILAGSSWVAAAGALAASPESACQNGRYGAAARYAQCETKATGKYLAGGDFEKFNQSISKCRIKYASTWTKLQAQATGTGSSCDTQRFTTAGGTATDHLTGLVWEQKTNDMTVHDRSNNYSWSAGTTDADGTVFTTFLPALNTGACFAGQCDWRLPTRAELETTLSEPYPCATNPCVDQTVFGPAFGVDMWTSTPDATSTTQVWRVFLFDGKASLNPKSFNGYVRAVRGGL